MLHIGRGAILKQFFTHLFTHYLKTLKIMSTDNREILFSFSRLFKILHISGEGGLTSDFLHITHRGEGCQEFLFLHVSKFANPRKSPDCAKKRQTNEGNVIRTKRNLHTPKQPLPNFTVHLSNAENRPKPRLHIFVMVTHKNSTSKTFSLNRHQVPILCNNCFKVCEHVKNWIDFTIFRDNQIKKL